MAIDVTREQLIPLADVPKIKWLPKRRSGSRLHLATVYRWVERGLHGVKLETLCAGGMRATSEAAVARFFERLSAQDGTAPTPSEVSTQHRHAERRLVSAGL